MMEFEQQIALRSLMRRIEATAKVQKKNQGELEVELLGLHEIAAQGGVRWRQYRDGIRVMKPSMARRLVWNAIDKGWLPTIGGDLPEPIDGGVIATLRWCEAQQQAKRRLSVGDAALVHQATAGALSFSDGPSDLVMLQEDWEQKKLEWEFLERHYSQEKVPRPVCERIAATVAKLDALLEQLGDELLELSQDMYDASKDPELTDDELRERISKGWLKEIGQELQGAVKVYRPLIKQRFEVTMTGQAE